MSYSNVQTLQLDATNQQNIFTVNPSLTTTYFINGYGPTTPGTGDVLSLNFTGTLDPLLVNPGDTGPDGTVFDGKWTFAPGNAQDVNFNGIASLPFPVIAYGADASVSGKPAVKVLFAGGTSQVLPTFNLVDPSDPSKGFLAYEPTYHGGVRIAVGYFDSSGQEEIATAPGPNHAPLIKIFSVYGQLLHQFIAYPSTMTKGINIAAGNVENLHIGIFEIDDLVTAPNSGVSDIRVYDNFAALPAAGSTSPLPYREFTAWASTFIGGSTVAVADLNSDGRGDIIVGSGPGMVPTIDAFNVTLKTKTYTPFRVFHPFSSTYRGGVNVSAISVGSGVTSPLVVASQGGSGTSIVQIFNGATGATVNTSTPFAGSGSNAPVRTVEKVIGGHLYVFAAQMTHGKSTAIREFDPSNPKAGYVDYILENDPNFLGIYLG